MCEETLDVLTSRSFSAIVLVLKNITKIWTILSSFRDFAHFLLIVDFVFIVSYCFLCQLHVSLRI